ncbi:Sulfotransferase 1C3 [Bienertia sinuspersici]
MHELRRFLTSIDRIPLHVGGESGSHWIHKLLNGHPQLCKRQLRVDKHIFINLVTTLMEKQLLSDGRFVLAAEQVGICLYILVKADSYRDAADRFQHSISTIFKYNRRVIRALVELSKDIIRPYQSLDEIP